MKKLYKYTLLLVAAFLFVPLIAHADEVEGIKLEKTVSGPDENNQYTIELGTFVTGTSVTTITQTTRATDIVLVLDVSGSMSDNITTYSKGNAVNSNSQLNWRTTYIITINGVDYYLREGRTTDDYIYYYSSNNAPGPDNGTLCYQGDRDPYVYEIINNVEGATGVYQITTSTQTRLAAMKTAAKAFVQTVFEKNPKKTDGTLADDIHQIAIVKFAGTWSTGNGRYWDASEDGNGYNGTRVVGALAPVNSATLYNDIIDGLWSGGATNSGRAMEVANGVFTPDVVANNGHPKVVVFFTDGEPGNQGFTGGDNSDKQRAYVTGRRAVNAAHAIKSITTTVKDQDGKDKIINGKVYSVALLTSGGQGDQAGRFLHYVSSNYDFYFSDSSTYNFSTNASTSNGASATPTNLDTGWTGATGGAEAPHGYYFLTGGGDLTSIFESIANESSQGSSDYSLKETSLVTVDVVSNYFKLPDGVNASNTSAIKVLFAPMTGIKDQSQWNNETYMKNLDNYVFGTPLPAAQAVANTSNPLILAEGEGDAQYPSVEIGKDNTQSPPGDKITVTNYNFADNYCGANKSSTGSFLNWRGYKLVIQIPIVVDVNNPGGASLQTNAEGSGLFVQNEQGGYDPLVEFPRPVLVLPNIIIRKYGMLYEKEGASFRLEKLKLKTGGTASNPADWEVDTSVKPYNIVIISKDTNPDNYDFVQVKLQHQGRYRVTETDWGWSYNCTADLTNLAETDKVATDEPMVPKYTNTNSLNQPFIDRDISGDTEQTITISAGNDLSGTVFDFRNSIKTTTDNKPIEHRNYSEANAHNEFQTKWTQTTNTGSN